jgi:hypothetical protein
METQTQITCQCLTKHKKILLTYLVVSLIMEMLSFIRKRKNNI